MHPTLSLYKKILKNARLFPSIKRDKIVAEIMETFRRNRDEADPNKLRLQLLVAEQGLSQLKAYTGMKEQSGHMEITLDQNPMPAPSENRFLKND